MRTSRFLTVVRTVLAIMAVALIVGVGPLEAGSYKTLHRFAGGKYGVNPYGGVILDGAGNLYGTTQSGGTYGKGVVYRLTRTSTGGWAEQPAWSFRNWGSTYSGLVHHAGAFFGMGPYCLYKAWIKPDETWGIHGEVTWVYGTSKAGLVVDSAGRLYGTTYDGGTFGKGQVFQVAYSSETGWTTSVIYSFTGDRDGAAPMSALIVDAAGNLYGTNSAGGLLGHGNVFELTPNTDGTWTETVLHQFWGSKDGGSPIGGLVSDGVGGFYGTTQAGGAYGFGVVFREFINSSGNWEHDVVHMFKGGIDGASPAASLVFDTAGNLYGTTTSGGPYGYGVVFKLMPSAAGGWVEKVLWSFRSSAGYPYAGVVLDKAGNLYGTTVGDGTTTFGTVFEITP